MAFVFQNLHGAKNACPRHYLLKSLCQDYGVKSHFQQYYSYVVTVAKTTI